MRRVEYAERLVGHVQVHEGDPDGVPLVVQALHAEVRRVVLEEAEGGDAALRDEERERPVTGNERPHRDHGFLTGLWWTTRNMRTARQRTAASLADTAHLLAERLDDADADFENPLSHGNSFDRFQLYDFLVKLGLYEGFVKLARASRLERMSSAEHGRPQVGLPARGVRDLHSCSCFGQQAFL